MSSSIDKVNQLLSGEWVIASKLDQNKVLDLNGDNVVLNDKNDSDTQKWTISYDTGSSIGRSFIIKNKSDSSKSLSHYNGNAILYNNYPSYAGAIYQRWYLYYQDDGSFIIANYVGDYLHPSVLDVRGSSTASGTSILSHAHSGNDNQRFYLVAHNYTYASDLDWESAQVGFLTAQKDKSPTGTTIQLYVGNDVVQYNKGLGAHANSEITYNIANKGFKAFKAQAGINANNGSTISSVKYIVKGDGNILYESDAMPYHTSTSVYVNVEGVSEIKLITQYTNGTAEGCHTVWGDAKFITNNVI